MKHISTSKLIGKLAGKLLAISVIMLISFSARAELLPVSSIFSEMDTNKDGVINRQEINKKSLLASEFDNIDKNQDNSLDFSEFEYFVVSINI